MNRLDADTLVFLTREIERAYADYMSYLPHPDQVSSLDIFKAGALRFHKLLDDEFIKLKSREHRRIKMAKASAKKATSKKAKKAPAKAAKKAISKKKTVSAKTSITKKRGRPAGSKNKVAQKRTFPKAAKA